MCVDILIVEDDLTDQFLIDRGLQEAGFKNSYEFVRSAEEAFSFLSGESRPRLIITDLNMPGTGGYGLLKYRNSRSDLSQIPTIVLSGSGDPYDVDKAYRLGANAYIEKPLRMSGYACMAETLQSYLPH